MPASFAKTLKMYALTGIVKAVKRRTRTLTLHSAHINGHKEKIERDYAIKKAAVFSLAREGDFVHATLLTDHADVWLLDEATFVHKRAPEEPKNLARSSVARLPRGTAGSGSECIGAPR